MPAEVAQVALAEAPSPRPNAKALSPSRFLLSQGFLPFAVKSSPSLVDCLVKVACRRNAIGCEIEDGSESVCA